MSISRRAFCQRMLGIAPAALIVTRQQGVRDTTHRTSQGVAGDTLITPITVATSPVGPMDNDPRVIGIERRLHCQCGCTLDVYTCRTTDFSCTVSPAMHRDVVTQVQAGSTDAEILQAFVAQDGASALMAPPARGFNLAGYLVPGLTTAAVGLALAAWLARRRAPLPAAATTSDATPRAEDGERLAELRRALDDVES